MTLSPFYMLSILNFSSADDLINKVSRMDKKSRKLVQDNCRKGIIRCGVDERWLTINEHVMTDASQIPDLAFRVCDGFQIKLDIIMDNFDLIISLIKRIIREGKEPIYKRLLLLGNSSFHMQFKGQTTKYYIDAYSSLRESHTRRVKLLNHSLNKGILLLSWGFVNL